ncbi:hypothetical protein LOTGIDRAFT_227257 [Lottia gigantea]|uniref:Uncharacterized protein n=1 Tax=Lottia gigantea TaxID=225164 RepID=V3ZUS8_LOTGI|nr:hypothetical protein LOTGIDRAFT_227257 [Lottia gigantea]ESO95248.1 hypothetical protein LOTGIDRAFT_227257 [Lottia gigantea]
MGNVSASSTPLGGLAPPPPVLPPQPPTQVPFDNNPGTFEEIHRRCKDIFPQIFEGGKLVISKGLSSNFQVSHTLALSTCQPSGYRFGSTYIGSKQLSPQESYPVILGDIDASGDLNAQVIHAFTERIRSKGVVQIQNNKCAVTQVTTDYKGDDYTASVTLGNIDPIHESGIVVSQYLQRVTRRLDLGAELHYQYGNQVPGGQIAFMSFAGKLSSDNWQFSGNVSPTAGNFHGCYVHKISEHLQLGAELETSLRMGDSTATVGYQIEIPNANVTFKGQVDSNYCVGAVMEKKITPFPFTFAFSGYLNHVKGTSRFGLGLVVG